MVRSLRLVCPACGHGGLFRRYFIRKELCSHCGWAFERGHGHWVGGAEVHMFASYGLSVLLFMPVLVLFDPTPWLLGAVIGGHLVLSVALHRYSRAVFLGIDYLVDPGMPSDGDDGEGGAREIVWPPAPGRSARAPVKNDKQRA